jgi:hypothetical protein
LAGRTHVIRATSPAASVAAAESTMRLGKHLAGHPTEEPRPREPTGDWSPFEPVVVAVHEFARPVAKATISFNEVLEARRSRIGGPVTWSQVADLLWFAAGARGYGSVGRSGLPIHWSPTPSAGGLGCVHVVCLAEEASPPRLYDPFGHRLLEIRADGKAVSRANRQAVAALVGTAGGCTLRLVVDWGKLSAAYDNAESLMFRNAGALMATLGLCATWLGMTACPLGLVGEDLVSALGFPADRFRAAGAVQIGNVER